MEKEEIALVKDDLVFFQISKRKFLTGITLACCFFGYMVVILNFKSFPVSLPEIINQGYINIAEGGQILASGNFACLVGKVILGLVSDKIGGRKLYLFCFFLIAIASISFSFFEGMVGFTLCWCLLRFGHSGAWPSISKFIAFWFEKKHWGKVWSSIGFSSRASSTLSSIIGGFVLSLFVWQWLFRFSGSIALLMLVLNGFLLRDSPAYWGLIPVNIIQTYDPDESSFTEKPITHHLDNATFKEAIVTFVKSPQCWMICLSMFFSQMIIEFGAFAPLYLNANFDLTPGEAGSISAIFPAGSATIVIIGGFVYDKLPEKGRKRGMFIVGVLLFTIIANGVMWGLFHVHLSWPSKFVVGLISIFVLGGALAPANYIPMSVFSVKFGGKHCGLLVGIIDAFAYTGSMIFSLVAGTVLENYGWEPFFIMLLVASGLASLCFSCFFVLDYKKASKETEEEPLLNIK